MHRIACSLFLIILIALVGCSEDEPTAPAVPILTLSADSLEFFAVAGGPNPPAQRIIVVNAGVGDMTFTATSPADWISVSYWQGTNGDTIRVAVSTARVQAGTNIDSIPVSSPQAGNTPQYIKVVFTVSNAISANPNSLTFSMLSGSLEPDTQYFQVVNEGGDFMTYNVSKGADWLSLTRTSGTAPDSIGVVVNPVGLSGGAYVDTLTVSSPEATNDSVHVAVTLTISSWMVSNQGLSVVHDLQGLFVFPPDVAWAVGFIGNAPEHSGVVFKSSDSGRTWEGKLSRTRTSFGGIHFVNSLSGCVVGDSAVIMRTSDGGETWHDVTGLPIDPTYSLWTVGFVGADTGWTVGSGGKILRTIDGGDTWQVQTSGTSMSLAAIEFVNSSSGWIVGNSATILHTVDGGGSWVPQTSPIHNDLWGVTFIDADNGFIVGSAGTMLHTTNGGANWTPVVIDVSDKLQDITFVDNLHGWAVGREGVIIHTSDGGANWLPQFTETQNWLYAVRFFDASIGLAAGEGGTMLRTMSGGF
ncbi:MAG TPA: YCF48-related protein [Acidobacteriota bacterium]|nr:YCF48-related protein [Acidobacteriota bacterium]